MSIVLIFVLAALVVTIMAAMGKAPLWVAVILLCIVEALHVLPIS